VVSTEIIFANTLTVRPHAGVARRMFLVSSNDLQEILQTIPMTRAAKAGKKGSAKTTKHTGEGKTNQVLKRGTELKGTHEP